MLNVVVYCVYMLSVVLMNGALLILSAECYSSYPSVIKLSVIV
jgi:hypothetical protein